MSNFEAEESWLFFVIVLWSNSMLCQQGISNLLSKKGYRFTSDSPVLFNYCFKYYFHSKPEGVNKDCLFGEFGVFASAVIEFLFFRKA